MSSTLRSIVEYHGPHDSYKCGYCKTTDSNFSEGMWAHALTVSDYQDLIDRGWRRSGQYCYKPTMNVLCCPMYTIRCRIQEFKPSKSQKKVLKRFNKYLIGEEPSSLQGGDSRKMSTCSSEGNPDLECTQGGEEFVESNKTHQDININDLQRDQPAFEEQDMKDFTKNDISEAAELNSTTVLLPSAHTSKEKETKKGVGLDPQKGPCKKAKLLRKERRLEKLKEKGVDVTIVDNNSKNKEKQVEDFINELPQELKHKLEIKLVRTTPPSPEWVATAKETHEVYIKYQTIIHDDKPEKFSQFKNFLVQSPLLEEYSDTGPACGYGSFHQQYWLDGKIIAVGVIDILPKCVSSVYFFYDPQYMNLTVGTYGALREIAFTRHLNSISPELKYYYMGYYIHSCRKMRYKGNFHPSDLLCPETYKWLPIKYCIPKLEASKYSRLEPDLDTIDDNYPTDRDINYIPIWVNGLVLRYKDYKRKFANKVIDDTEEMTQYARLVGTRSAKNLILVK